MRELVCPNCGTADPDQMLTVTKPNAPDGVVLLGYRCEICDQPVVDYGEPADEPTSGAD
jgi:hypothetical protein